MGKLYTVLWEIVKFPPSFRPFFYPIVCFSACFYAFLPHFSFFLSLLLLSFSAFAIFKLFLTAFAKCLGDDIMKSMEKHYTSYRQAGIYLACILFLAILLLLPGCSAMNTASTVADTFMEHMQNQDFSAAYSCLWKRAGCVKEETFVSCAQNICDSLGVTSISFPSHELSVEGNQVKFSYTMLMRTAKILP